LEAEGVRLRDGDVEVTEAVGTKAESTADLQ
jgi:hypothetical protein